jgi:DNA invertase Pin-like site-specific DNA recombinase
MTKKSGDFAPEIHRIACIPAVGQAEREAMLERQREGIAKAKREGRYKGRLYDI